jgi:ketosteroid isomerase-like protein
MTTDLDVASATGRFLDLLEAGDLAGVTAMLHPDVVWSAPMTFTGNPDGGERVKGTTAFLARLGSIGALMRSVRFTNRRVTTSVDGLTTFVQTRGDFCTGDGRPYRNVYVFRFDWRDGTLASWEEYANPITVLRAFPAEYGEAVRQLAGQ